MFIYQLRKQTTGELLQQVSAAFCVVQITLIFVSLSAGCVQAYFLFLRFFVQTVDPILSRNPRRLILMYLHGLFHKDSCCLKVKLVLIICLQLPTIMYQHIQCILYIEIIGRYMQKFSVIFIRLTNFIGICKPQGSTNFKHVHMHSKHCWKFHKLQ